MFTGQVRIWVQTKLKYAEMFKRKGDWPQVAQACAEVRHITSRVPVEMCLTSS